MTKDATAGAKEKWRWPAFWQRFKSREVTADDIDVFTFRIIMPLMLPALLPLVLQTEGAAGDEFLQMAYRWIAPPVVALFGVLSYRTRPGRSVFGIIWRFFAPVAGGLLFTYSTIGFFNLANALTGSDEVVLVSGPVIRKADTSGRMGPRAYLYISHEEREVKLKVPLSDWRTYSVGDSYAIPMHRGGLGYFYRWIWSR